MEMIEKYGSNISLSAKTFVGQKKIRIKTTIKERAIKLKFLEIIPLKKINEI